MARELLTALGVAANDGPHVVHSPIDGSEIGRVAFDAAKAIDAKIAASAEAFRVWREVPAPRRGELVRLFGEELRTHKEQLGRLVTLEAGKILQEGLGEVQEMIDICDFAVGLSRQLYGLTIASERPGHRMMEIWHPAGPVAVISAFNFPVAVWAWNAALALVCGDSVIWKPSEKTPLTALASQALFERAAKRFGTAPAHLSQIVLGAREAGERLASDVRIPIVSATGSTRMGRELAPTVAGRFGKSILELGGNNAMIVAPTAKLDLALRAILFAAVGTAGQRCTSLRRLFVHDTIYDKLVPALKTAYGKLAIGDPLNQGTLVGPLIDKNAFENMDRALKSAKAEGGTVTGGGRVLDEKYPDGFYVRPAIVEIREQTETVRRETFAPILYVMRYSRFEDALAQHNAVPQGLSSCIFTLDMQEAERFIAASGSDCGIANVNIGPSGAEIGGAFGGEKETGGGRESGSDAWKAYMRRQTATINYSDALPLAQGIEFGI
ncbi:MAG TPA: aldehyde dehydrogenase family protein [Rhizomicrobium sp.]